MALQAPAASAQDNSNKPNASIAAPAAAAKPSKPTTMAAAPAAAQPAPTTALANAPESGAAAASAHPPAKKPAGQYYVDFRARTAASYGHAFVWYGRSDVKAVDVAGLHPATDSTVPYVIGHVLPVASETGASYGDLDPQYVTANYRVFMSDTDAKRVFAYIKHLQNTNPIWNAATFNCVWFISQIAQYMGLKVPASNLLYPEDWVNELKSLNGGRKMVRLTPDPQQILQTSSER